VRVKVSRDDRERKRFSWRTTFPNVKTEAGEHECLHPYGNPYVRLSYTLNDSARHLQDGFAVTSIDRRGVSVPIVFKVTPQRLAVHWRVTASVVPVRELGGSATLAVSRNGENWSSEVWTDPKGGKRQTLTLAGEALRGFGGAAPFWVRVILVANAGKKTNVASRLTALEVSASLMAD